MVRLHRVCQGGLVQAQHCIHHAEVIPQLHTVAIDLAVGPVEEVDVAR